MNRHQRRAEGRKRATSSDKAVVEAMRYLARVADPTATGATLMRPDGSTVFISADDACALYGAKPARGHA